MTESREQTIERLMAFPNGLSREEAEPRLLDDDLWMVGPEMRTGLSGEEAVEAWAEAASFATGLAEGFCYGPVGAATYQMLMDMKFRANEALRRAKQRSQEDAA